MQLQHARLHTCYGSENCCRSAYRSIKATDKPFCITAKVSLGRKQGRKRGLDAVEMCAPDSVRAKAKQTSEVLSNLTF